MLISMEEVGIKTVTASVVFASGCPIRRRTRSCWSRNSRRRRRRRRRNGSRTIRFYTAAVAERVITVATAAGRRITEMRRLLDVVI